MCKQLPLIIFLPLSTGDHVITRTDLFHMNLFPINLQEIRTNQSECARDSPDVRIHTLISMLTVNTVKLAVCKSVLFPDKQA